ncbi:MAG TPA: hypothetical protein PLH91_02885 [Tenuifilaceae bacterium]|nr:hypothetical protein [Tenuifilaceae bacterium]
MELVFNELSFREYQDDYGLINSFILLGELFEKSRFYGYNHLLFPSNLSVIKACNNKNFSEWLNNIPTPKRNKILPIIFKRPFTDDYLGDKRESLASYYFVSEELKIKQEYCDGLATAEIMDIPSISLSNHQIWLNNRLTIFKESEHSPLELEVTNLATDEFLNSDEFRNFSERISTVNLQPSLLTLDQKHISLRDDHGKDKLQKLAERMVKNIYVNGIINSMPFNSKTSRFIKSVYKNGIIEVVMHWEDAGYGMVIETTGRNFKETNEIAKILRDEFDR